MKNILKFIQWKENKLLSESFIVNNNNKYGQVLYLVGGAGSGKDFVTEKLAIANIKQYKKFSSDTIVEFLPKEPRFEDKIKYTLHCLDTVLLKKQVLADKKQQDTIEEWLSESIPHVFSDEQSILDYIKIELPREVIANKEKKNKLYYSLISIKNDKNVSLLRLMMYLYNLDENYINTFIRNSRTLNENNLSNIAIEFIGTISSFKKKTDLVLHAGYKKENISVVWVLTKREIAHKNNKLRDRKLNDKVLESTHSLAATNLSEFFKSYETYMDGEIWIIFNSSLLNKFEQDTESTLSAREQFKIWNNSTKSYHVDKLDENVTSVKIKAKNKPIFADFHSLIDIDGFKQMVNLFASYTVF